MPRNVIDEVMHRTPGYTGSQQEEWLACCRDAAVYQGRFGNRELADAPPEALEAVRRASGFEAERWRDFLSALEANGSPTAYLVPVPPLSRVRRVVGLRLTVEIRRSLGIRRRRPRSLGTVEE